MRLEDKVIVVTGASRGIGKAMANAFVDEGASVACASRTEETLREAVEDINDGPGTAIAIPTDIRSESSIAELFEKTRSEFGPIDVLVNNAAVSQRNLVEGGHRPIAEIPIDVWDTIIETNLRGTFICTQEALSEMLERDSGKIIHISSRGGERAKANRGAYAPSKFGIEALHEGLAKEISETGVSSVILRPPQGGTRSGMRTGEDGAEYQYEPTVMAETAVRLALCEGENGGRYVPTSDGNDYIQWPRKVERPSDHPDLN